MNMSQLLKKYPKVAFSSGYNIGNLYLVQLRKMAVVSHTPEFFQQRCSNDPNRAVEIAFAAKNELSQRLTTVTALATKKPLVEQSGETRRDCRTVLHYVDPVKAPAEWLADPNATKSEPSYVL